MGIIEKCKNNIFKYACLFITFFIEVFNYSIVHQRFLWINSAIFLWKVLLSLYLIFTVQKNIRIMTTICFLLAALVVVLFANNTVLFKH